MEVYPYRKSIRLKNYDYRSNGVYHVTICTQNHKCLFGTVVNGEMILSEVGWTAYHNAQLIAQHYPEVQLIEFVIMPNHAHLLLVLVTQADANYGVPTAVHSLGQIVRAYKASVSRVYGSSIWQPRFYEHIIRGKRDYLDTIAYIQNNPASWNKDDYYLPSDP